MHQKSDSPSNQSRVSSLPTIADIASPITPPIEKPTALFPSHSVAHEPVKVKWHLDNADSPTSSQQPLANEQSVPTLHVSCPHINSSDAIDANKISSTAAVSKHDGSVNGSNIILERRSSDATVQDASSNETSNFKSYKSDSHSTASTPAPAPSPVTENLDNNAAITSTGLSVIYDKIL